MKIFSEKALGRVAAVLAALTLISLLSGCSVFNYIIGRETTEAGTTAAEPDVTSEADPSGDTTGTGQDTGTEPPVTLPPDTTAGFISVTDPPVIKYYPDPLTGLQVDFDASKVRPVAIAVDNISAASPQSGISRAAIVIECMVENGISRLILITNRYESNEVWGPVRSVRDYMVSLSAAFGTLLVGAGYSPTGYTSIVENSVDYIDGVHDRYALSGFFRDPARYEKSGYEHSLMITGQGIRALAAHNNYTLAANVSQAFKFSSSAAIPGADATHAVLSYSSYQQVQLIYSRKENVYYRYQYGTKAHIDAETGEQLSFSNVFILFAEQGLIEGDTEGRISVGVTGTGDGYYLTGAKYIPITWTRSGFSSAFSFTSGSGSFSVAPGKTFITIVDSRLKDTSAIVLNYKMN